MKIRIKRYIGFMLIFAMLSSNIVSAFGYESTALSDVNFSVNFIEKSSLQTQFENGTNETYNEFGTMKSKKILLFEASFTYLILAHMLGRF